MSFPSAEKLPDAFGLAQDAIEEMLLRQRAERRSKERDQFTSMIAHDLRTPLTVIKAAASLIRKNGSSPPATMIINMVDRTDRMIQDLLDFEKLRSCGSRMIDRQEMDLVDSVRGVLDELRLVHGDRFALKGAVAAPGRWDSRGVRRVVENILLNAVKYGSPSTPVTVTVRGGRKQVALSVHNHGTPIRAEMRRRLFAPFQRGKSQERIEGWGLGLALVYEICRAHEGQVWVKSGARTGTSFTVRLPRD